jgi:hypothetical protein
MSLPTAQLEPNARPRRRPLAATLFACAALLGACGADDDKKAVDRPFRPATTPAPAAPALPAGTVTTASGGPRKATVADARKAVDSDRYVQAEQTLAALSAADRKAIRVRIANRMARRAGAALRRGNASRVESLLAQMRAYPATGLTRRVRGDYRAAVADVAERDRERLLSRKQQARQRRIKARAERAAKEARKAQQLAEQQARQQDKP